MGDAFVDRYHISTSCSLSAEAPIPVCKVGMVKEFHGGALNVKMNLLSLGAEAYYLYPPLPTQHFPIKNRLMFGDSQLARWDEEDWCPPYQKVDLLTLLDGYDALVVSDYGKGSITKEVIQILRDVSQNIPVFVDTKCDPSPWLGSEAILFPNLKEYKQFEQGYGWFPKLVLKKGEEGVSLLEYGTAVLSRPSLVDYVVSVNGAGDTLLAAFVIATLSGSSLNYCLEWSQAAAAVAVENPYTYSPSVEEVDEKYWAKSGDVDSF